MADRHFADTGHLPQEGGEVVEVQIVARVDPQAGRQRGLRGLGVAGANRLLGGAAMGAGIGLGVELDPIGPGGAGGGHGLRQRVHEQAHPHPQRVAFVDQRAQRVGVGRQVPAVVGGELANAVGHEGGLVRADLAHQVHQVVQRIALDVVFHLGPVAAQQLGQVAHILIADVALVRARVHGDAVGASLQHQAGRPGDAGDAQVAGVAQQGHLVQVDRQGRAAQCPAMGKRFSGDERIHAVFCEGCRRAQGRQAAVSMSCWASIITSRVRRRGVPR